MTRILLTITTLACIMCHAGCATTNAKLKIGNTFGVDYHVSRGEPVLSESVKVEWEF